MNICVQFSELCLCVCVHFIKSYFRAEAEDGNKLSRALNRFSNIYFNLLSCAIFPDSILTENKPFCGQCRKVNDYIFDFFLTKC